MWSGLVLLLGALGLARVAVPRKTRLMSYLAVRAAFRALERAARRMWIPSETVQDEEDEEGPPGIHIKPG